MVKFLKAAALLSFVVIILIQSAFANGSTALVSYLQTSEGLAKFSATIAGREGLVGVQNFIRISGVSQTKITEALQAKGLERATKFRALMEEALTRSASDPRFAGRASKTAQQLLGVTDAELSKVASLNLQGGQGAGRAELIRGGKDTAIEFGTMPGGKYGPPMPVGPVATPVTEAVPALVENLARVEQAAGRSLPVGFENAVKDPEIPGEGMFDACLGEGGTALELAPRRVLTEMVASADRVSARVADRDIAVTEEAVKVNMTETVRDCPESVEAVDTLANQCGYLGARYRRGIAKIRTMFNAFCSRVSRLR